jgi:mono/diheme cytochrome c family protein
MQSICRGLIGLLGMLLASGTGQAEDAKAEPTPAERGRIALLTKTYAPTTLTRAAYEDAWKQWGLEKKPAPEEYARLFRQRYGLHEAPYENKGLPMGMKEADLLLGFGKKGIGQDCLICHGGSIAGKSYIGLGNASLDYQTFFEETMKADGKTYRPPFQFCNVRGTNEAGSMALYLHGFREPDLRLREWRDLGLHADQCEDVPAWWLLKKKKTMYHNGGGDQRSVRSLMQFMLTPLNTPEAFTQAEADFKDIREFLLSIEAPKYPLATDANLAKEGAELFKTTCSRCHGTYGPDGRYPNKIIPIDEIGTDRKCYEGITAKFGEYYNKSWFSKDHVAVASKGYQSPPLDGIWATAPYFHNASAPTVYHVLNSKARPAIFTRSYRTDLEAYDSKHLGWKIEVLRQAPDVKKLEPIEARKIYDTHQPGRANTGHTFGDHLTDAERFAIIEYLKTL